MAVKEWLIYELHCDADCMGNPAKDGDCFSPEEAEDDARGRGWVQVGDGWFHPECVPAAADPGPVTPRGGTRGVDLEAGAATGIDFDLIQRETALIEDNPRCGQ